jgi:hypothetical protein
VTRRAHAAIQVKTGAKIKSEDGSQKGESESSNLAILFLERRQTGKFNAVE